MKVQGDNHFVIDEKQIKGEARYGGGCCAATTVYNAETVAHVYVLSAVRMHAANFSAPVCTWRCSKIVVCLAGMS